MATFIPLPGDAWRQLVKEKWTRHALDELSTELGASLADIQDIINNIEINIGTLDLTHDLLDTPTHVDTETNPPLPGSLVVGSAAGVSNDMSPYWVDGLPVDLLNSTDDTGGVQFWQDGLPFNSISSLSAGDVLWVRLEIGQDTYVLTSRGTFVEWAPATAAFSQIRASADLTAPQAIPKETATLLVWDTPTSDSGPFWSSAAPTRFTCPTGQDGTFDVTGQATWDTGTIGALRIRILKNGSAVARNETGGTVVEAAPSQTVMKRVELSATDYVELEAYWTYSDSSDRTITDGTGETFFQIQRCL